MREEESIRKLGDVPIDQYEYADYKHLFKTNKVIMSHVSVNPGQSVPAHTHDNEEQTYWVIRGKGLLRLGENEYEVEGGQGIYIPLGTEHTIKNIGEEPLEYVFFAAVI